MGVFAVLTKGVVHRLSDGGWGVFASAELYAWLAVAIGKSDGNSRRSGPAR
ncbi:hypothetical protein [Mycobacterium simiae]|uniref:hypothetical protein n=1 Tax=Mycobacterium simiae TaxID=1784 RepID=UPI000CBCEF9F|nr:hypothetical protein X011_05205 [Mycobacterium tuberculosis variant microti OV254]